MTSADVPFVIYAHRGYWQDPACQNSPEAILAARIHGFAAEIDIRDRNRRIVIDHDPPREDEKCTYLDDLMTSDVTLALNLKASGLVGLLDPFRDWIERTQSWFFDGSLPEMFEFHRSGFRHALRVSEYESQIPWKSEVVWVDSFHSNWFINRLDIFEMYSDSHIVFVSPELHGRDSGPAWEYFSDIVQFGVTNVGFCTDQPNELAIRLSDEV